MSSEDLPALQRKISEQLARRPEYFVTHPAELKALRRLTSDKLEEFAHENSWRVIRRLGGKQFQFYNDSFER